MLNIGLSRTTAQPAYFHNPQPLQLSSDLSAFISSATRLRRVKLLRMTSDFGLAQVGLQRNSRVVAYSSVTKWRTFGWRDPNVLRTGTGETHSLSAVGT